MYLYSEALLSMQLPKVLPLLMRFITPYIYNVLTQGQLCGEANARRFTDQTKMPSAMLTNLTPHELEPCLLFCLFKKIVKSCFHWPVPHIPSHSLEDGVWLKWHAKPLASRPSPQIAVRAGLGSINGSNIPHHVSLHGKLQKCKILQTLPVQQNPVYGP